MGECESRPALTKRRPRPVLGGRRAAAEHEPAGVGPRGQ